MKSLNTPSWSKFAPRILLVLCGPGEDEGEEPGGGPVLLGRHEGPGGHDVRLEDPEELEPDAQRQVGEGARRRFGQLEP